MRRGPRRRLAPASMLVVAALALPCRAAAQDTVGVAAVRGVTPAVLSARARIDEGRPLTAARELARALALSDAAPHPAEVMLAARAHARIQAWPAVARLLGARTWIDSIAPGEARLLLGRAHLEAGRPEEAIPELERALDDLPDTDLDPEGVDARLRALVELARALEATDRDEEAAVRWLAAAERRPAIGHWLRLSALQALARAGRAREAQEVARTLAEARGIPGDSVRVETARAWFRAGNADRGLAAADSLGDRTAAGLAGDWILPALLARGDTAAALREARRAIEAGGTGPEAGALLLAADSGMAVLRAVAASDRKEGRAARAERLLETAVERAGPDDEPDLRLDLAEVRFSRGDLRGTERALAPWLGPGDGPGTDRLRSRAWFLAGRAVYRRGHRRDAFALWERTAAVAGAPDGAWAAFLLGDILHDEGDLDGAAAAYERTVERHPRSAYAGTALFRLGALAVLREQWGVASQRFDEYVQRSPGGNWYQASLYWKGRARSAAGDPGGALAAWQRALDYDPLGYYGLLASRALGVDAWASLRRSDAAPAPPPDAGDRALVGRMDDLRALGWRRRAVRELSARERRGETAAERLSLALLLDREGWTWQGTAIADGVRRARGGGWTDELLRAVYPLVYRPALLSAADETGLDPALVAAIVRRESQFDRAVVSSAGAVGLMQVLPSTGAELARKEGIPDFRRSQLTVPEVNLVLGTSYLRELLDRNGGSLAAALISYNAGPHRWARWRSYPEFRSDAELMVERIPFSETRVYVKTITAYREIYRRLWGLGEPVDAPAGGS